MNPQKVEWALKNFKEAGLDKMIEIKQGLALNLLHDLKGQV